MPELVSDDGLQLVAVARRIKPSVTAMCACSCRGRSRTRSGLVGTSQMRGRGMPAAIVISSTTFTSRVSTSSLAFDLGAPVDQSSAVGPVFRERREPAIARSVVSTIRHGKA